jgi:hypothetical protein
VAASVHKSGGSSLVDLPFLGKLLIASFVTTDLLCWLQTVSGKPLATSPPFFADIS